jgi:nicotinate-nucleotide pyrophosphorylase (carboxylating)
LQREKLVEQAYQKGNELSLNNKNYLNWLQKFFEQEYKEDVGQGDITSQAVLTANKRGKAVLRAKQEGVIAGIEEVSWFLKKHGLKVKIRAKDADKVKKGDTILEVYGKQRDILATERVGLNVMQRTSGIATETRKLVDLIEDYKTRIAATRKTVLRYLDKKAVYLGGGLTHRFGLWDAILIKDNHLEALKNQGIKNPIEKAITLVSKHAPKVGFIEIETTNQEDALKAARKFKQLKLKKPCIVMLDNVEPREIQSIIEKLKNENLHNHVLLEASGNITPENIRDYAKTEVDVISLGYLTHSARILDISLEMTS